MQNVKREMSQSELCDTRRVCWQFSVARPDYKKYRHIGTCSFRPAVSRGDRQSYHTPLTLGSTQPSSWTPGGVRTPPLVRIASLLPYFTISTLSGFYNMISVSEFAQYIRGCHILSISTSFLIIELVIRIIKTPEFSWKTSVEKV